MKQDARNCVIGFIEEMNDWGHKMYLLSRIQDGQVINHARDREIIPSISYEEFNKLYYKIFNKYCTQRERVYGGHPNTFARNGLYDGMNMIDSIEQINKKRIEIIVSGGFMSELIKFIVFYKNSQWLIDSAKTLGLSDKWENYYL